MNEKHEEIYALADFNPNEENTDHRGGKTEHRRGEEGEEDEDEDMMGGRKVKCANQ